jgi:hypothetical protein
MMKVFNNNAIAVADYHSYGGAAYYPFYGAQALVRT